MIKIFQGGHFFLSNFFPTTLVHDGVNYPSVEHAFQACKTPDIKERVRISNLASPGQAKRAGRQVSLRSDWQEVRVTIMRMLVRKKFSKPQLANMLLKTGTEELIEGNTWNDVFWGKDLTTMHGENMLGRILMEIREGLHVRKEIKENLF